MKHKSIAAALVEAQKKIGAAKKGSANPFFKSKFADLGAVIEVVKEAMNEEGISITQPVQYMKVAEADKERIYPYLVTTLLHESGEKLTSEMPIPPNPDIQKFGAAVTYCRRYALQSFLLVPAEDLDGEDVVEREPKKTSRVKPTVTTEKKKPAFLKG